MSKALLSVPRKSGIDPDFYDELNRLKAERQAVTQAGTAAPPKYPELRITDYLRAVHPLIPMPGPSTLASTPSTIAQSAEPVTRPKPLANPHSVPRLKIYSDGQPLPASSGTHESRTSVAAESDESPRRRAPDSILLPELPDDEGQDAGSASHGSSAQVSPSQTPRASPRNSLQEISTPSPTTSSSQQSPVTTPRQTTPPSEKSSGGRKLVRKATSSFDNLADALRYPFQKIAKAKNAHVDNDKSRSGSRSPRRRLAATASDVDLHVELEDAAFRESLETAVNEYFHVTWEKENSGKENEADIEESYRPHLQSTLIRDFGNSTYCFQRADGTKVKMAHINEFYECLCGHVRPEMIRRASHFANQNLTQFLRQVLFARSDKRKAFQSALNLVDGTPLIPVGTFKAVYTLSTDADGSVIIDYAAELVPNAANMLNVRISGDADYKTYSVSNDARLKISTRITIKPDDECHIADPRVQASGWKLTE